MEPAASDDWIGLFAKNEESRKVTSQTTGGASAGQLAFVIPSATASGEYQFRMYSRNTWQLVQTSQPFRIKGMAAQIDALPSEAQPGSTVGIRWTGIDAPLPGDWVGIFDSHDTHKKLGNFLTGGTKTGRTRWTVPPAATPGSYEISLFSGNTWQSIAHATLTIRPAGAEAHGGTH
jgi:hypothetical protein